MSRNPGHSGGRGGTAREALLEGVPGNVLNDINRRAKRDYREDHKMRAHIINGEIRAYKKFAKFKFGRLPPEAIQKISREANETFDTWQDRLSDVKREVSAARSVFKYRDPRIPRPALNAILGAVKEEDAPYSQQLDQVKRDVEKFARDQAIRVRLDPIKQLLIILEKFIGNECYNGNIQNYGPWGEFQGSGRTFRYPVTFPTDSSADRHWTVSEQTDSLALIRAYYKFGANQLYIFGALVKMLEWLEEHYGIDIRELERQRAKPRSRKLRAKESVNTV